MYAFVYLVSIFYFTMLGAYRHWSQKKLVEDIGQRNKNVENH